MDSYDKIGSFILDADMGVNVYWKKMESRVNGDVMYTICFGGSYTIELSESQLNSLIENMRLVAGQ